MTDVRNGAPTREELQVARLQLSRFVRAEAGATAGELGFAWRSSDVAPVGLASLRAEFKACHASGLSFRVLRKSENTVYDCPSTHHAMRFVHATRHVWLSADHSAEAELEVASCHLARAKAEGLESGSLAYALLMADTVGVTLYLARAERFVTNRLAFAIDCVRFDFDTAVRRELDRSCVTGHQARPAES